MRVEFDGGRMGREESGTWVFWTVGDYSTFRVREGENPRIRADSFVGDPLYKDHWHAATGEIRAATPLEVAAWMLEHIEDGRHANLSDVFKALDHAG